MIVIWDSTGWKFFVNRPTVHCCERTGNLFSFSKPIQGKCVKSIVKSLFLSLITDRSRQLLAGQYLGMILGPLVLHLNSLPFFTGKMSTLFLTSYSVILVYFQSGMN